MFVNKNENNCQQNSLYSIDVNNFYTSCKESQSKNSNNFKHNNIKNNKSDSERRVAIFNSQSEDKENQAHINNLNVANSNPVFNIEKYTQSQLVKTNHELIKNYLDTLEKDKRSPQITENSIIIQEKVVRTNGEVDNVNYIVGKCIGKGGFAKCYELINLETKHISAVKVVQKFTLEKSRARAKLISEIKIHRSLQNEHIVKFEHFFEDEYNVYLMLEICNNQTLNDLLKRRKRLSEFEVAYYANQILEALKYLHTNNIIHRDLKLGNLFLTEKMQLKLGDFGLATKLNFEGEKKRTVCGTPNYLAPEILESKNGHSYEIDIWALGVIIFTLLVGKPPFESITVKQTYERIKKNDYKFPEKIDLSQAAKKLINQILVKDPSSRPSLDEIKISDFLNVNLPIFLPASTLVLIPHKDFVKKFWVDEKTPIHKNKLSEHKFFSDKSNDTLLLNINHKFREVYCKNILTKKKNVVIEKFVDYSARYGIAYLLSNNSIGVYFNDTSKIVLDPAGDVFHYLEKQDENKVEVMSIFRIDNYPEYISKKVILLNYFKDILTGTKLEVLKSDFDKKGDILQNLVKETNTKLENPNQSQIFVYLKKWLRTNCATIFRLSNKICQIIFNDQTQILICSETKEVTYLNKLHEEETEFLVNAMESKNLEMVKRLEYTKEILNYLLKRKKSTDVKLENY
jgi:polo-like kinase 1